MKFIPTGDNWSITLEEPIEVEEWIEKDQGSNIKVLIKNRTMQSLQVSSSLVNGIIYLDKNESKEYITPLDMAQNIIEDKLCISYVVEVGSFKVKRDYIKSIEKIKMIKGKGVLDSFEWKPNILLKDKLQVRRGEKHWQGLEDLSGEAMLFATEKDLVLRVKVSDDCVLFGGGKFYYDNDSIQIYFDRRDEKYRNITSLTKNIYEFITIPGVNDNCSTVVTLGTNIKDNNGVGISIHKTEMGYESLLAIPWELIGGRPNSGDLWGFDLIINDRDSGARRDLQMVWTGCAADERIYLLQEHHNPKRFGLIIFE